MTVKTYADKQKSKISIEKLSIIGYILINETRPGLEPQFLGYKATALPKGQIRRSFQVFNVQKLKQLLTCLLMCKKNCLKIGKKLKFTKNQSFEATGKKVSKPIKYELKPSKPIKNFSAKKKTKEKIQRSGLLLLQLEGLQQKRLHLP